MNGKYAAIVTCRTKNGTTRTTATVHGAWAVHQSLDKGSREWAITQVSNGLAIPREHTWHLKKVQAIEVARLVDLNIGDRKIGPTNSHVVLAIIHGVVTGSAKKSAAQRGMEQHDADIAEGCP